MGLRETLNRNPVIVIGAAVVVILGSAYIIYRSIASSRASRTFKIPTQYYYTVDDGKSFFADSMERIPPYKTANGEEAVRAHVFKCKGGQPFVGYLERYTDAAREAHEKAQGGNANARIRMMEEMDTGKLVRKPGSTEGPKWLPAVTQNADWQKKADEITAIKCPNAKSDDDYPAEVFPE